MSKNIADIYQLSPMQQGMLFHTLHEPEKKPYFQQESYNIQGELDVAIFKKVWQQIMDYHPILRTAFNWERREKPLQIVYRHVELPWRQEDWRGLTSLEQQERMRDFIISDREQGFDLASAPLMRLTLFQLGDREYQFTWSFHHLLLDGWSKSLIFREALAFYKAAGSGQVPGLERSRPFRDYIAWLKQQEMGRAEAFWRETLRDFRAPTPLGLDRKLPDSRTPEEGYDKQILNIGPATLGALQAFTRQHRLTLNTLMQGVWAQLLSRYSGEEKVLYGFTVSGRPPDLAGAEEMVGMLINTIPAVVHVAPEAPLVAWLKQLQAQQVEARQFEYSPLVQVHGWSEVPRSQPLFESILIFENFPRDIYMREGGGGLKFSLHRFNHPPWSHLPLTLIASAGTELELEMLYDRRRFDGATITRMTGHFERMLEGIVENPARKLSELPLLSKAEEQQLLFEWNDTTAEYASDYPLHELFEAQATRTPDAVAVSFEGQQLSYRELDTRANQLAHHLRSLGVGPEVRVGICVERSLEMVVGLVGILKAGGAYVPLDPEYPQERLAFMLADSEVAVLLTQSSLLDALPSHNAHLVHLDTDWPLIAGKKEDSPRVAVSAENAAYVIYTSGSTGRPKGVLVTHGSVARLFTATDSWTHFDQRDVWTLFHSYAFDFSVWEIWGALLYGGRLVVVPFWVSRSPESFYELLREERVTVLNQTPSAFRQLMRVEETREHEPGDLALRLVIFGGEALEIRSLRPWFARHGDEKPQLVNMYGITETTVHVTHRRLWKKDADDAVGSVIGVPIADQQVYILNAVGQLVPAGVIGEMYVGGAGHARGYLNRPELTAERFIPNPFSRKAGQRLYRTGDLARHLPGGKIEYLGRIDQQVKIRGFRIEPGEIEAALAAHEGVQQAVVALAAEGEDGEKRLVAYIVEKPEHKLNGTELRSHLKERLPDYMIPSAFAMVAELALTPSGKIDRRALPSIDQARPELEKPFIAPRTPVEQELAAIWCELLGLERVGIDDNFFELGGHSLLITQFASRIRQKFEVDISLRQLFNMPTIVEITKAIALKQVEREDSEEAAQLLEELKRLSPAEIKVLLEAEEGALTGPET